jgi:hypothetical protein
VDQKTRDTEYATMPMNFRMAKEAMEYQGRALLDRTEPRLEAELMEADNVMAAETRSTGYHYRHYDKFTGEWKRRWTANPQCLPEHIHRDPEVQREGNDVTQSAFQSPYAQPVPYCGYEQLIYCRDNVSSTGFTLTTGPEVSLIGMRCWVSICGAVSWLAAKAGVSLAVLRRARFLAAWRSASYRC